MKNTFAVLLILLTLNACKKAEQGEPGKDGNANVKSSSVSVYWDQWEYSNGVAYFNMYMPEITTDILSKGTVSVFMESGNGTYQALPWNLPDTGNDYDIVYSYNISEHNIFFQIHISDGTDISSVSTHTYKVVIISGQ